MKYHFALLGVMCAYALARDESSSKALKATAVTQAPWNNAVLHTGLKSALFAKCITAASTRKLQYYAIHWNAQGIHFAKYDVNRHERGLTPVIWDKEIQCNDIIDCSKASKDSLMFQYDGQTCRMVNRIYCDTRDDFCDTTGGLEKNVVYLNQAKRRSGCPANTDIIEGSRGRMCLGGSQQDVPFKVKEAYISCYYQYNGAVYSGGFGVNFTTVRNHMRNKNYQGEFFVGVTFDTRAKVYAWYDSGAFSKTFIAVAPREPIYQLIAVISSSHDYLLVMKNNTDLITGYICVGPEL